MRAARSVVFVDVPYRVWDKLSRDAGPHRRGDICPVANRNMFHGDSLDSVLTDDILEKQMCRGPGNILGLERRGGGGRGGGREGGGYS